MLHAGQHDLEVTSQISGSGATNGIGPRGNTRFGMPGSGFRLTNGSPESRAGYMKCPCGDIFNSHCLEENLVHVLHISAAQA